MRFSWLTKQNLIALVLLFSIDIVFFLISVSHISFKNPYISLILTLIMLMLAGFTIQYIKRLDRGADGEASVRQELKELPFGFYHLNDFNYNNRNSADMVVIGPTGIFTIEVKNYYAREITCRNDMLLGDGRPLKKNVINQAYAEKKNLQAYLATVGMSNIPIYPVVVFTNRRTKIRLGPKPIKGVYVIGKAWIQKMILEKSYILSQEQCNLLRTQLQKHTSII
jgi:Nuclease-related domain